MPGKLKKTLFLSFYWLPCPQATKKKQKKTESAIFSSFLFYSLIAEFLSSFPIFHFKCVIAFLIDEVCSLFSCSYYLFEFHGKNACRKSWRNNEQKKKRKKLPAMKTKTYKKEIKYSKPRLHFLFCESTNKTLCALMTTRTTKTKTTFGNRLYHCHIIYAWCNTTYHHNRHRYSVC